MSTLEFDGQSHILTLKDEFYKIVATGHANNRTASTAPLQFVLDGHYAFQDICVPHRHGHTADTHNPKVLADSVNGEYGSYGIIRFDVPRHPGVGVHAGRQTLHDLTPQRSTGPDYVTMGCIRTNEVMMGQIVTHMRMDPLQFLYVHYNRRQR